MKTITFPHSTTLIILIQLSILIPSTKPTPTAPRKAFPILHKGDSSEGFYFFKINVWKYEKNTQKKSLFYFLVRIEKLEISDNKTSFYLDHLFLCHIKKSKPFFERTKAYVDYQMVSSTSIELTIQGDIIINFRTDIKYKNKKNNQEILQTHWYLKLSKMEANAYSSNIEIGTGTYFKNAMNEEKNADNVTVGFVYPEKISLSIEKNFMNEEDLIHLAILTDNRVETIYEKLKSEESKKERVIVNVDYTDNLRTLKSILKNDSNKKERNNKKNEFENGIKINGNDKLDGFNSERLDSNNKKETKDLYVVFIIVAVIVVIVITAVICLWRRFGSKFMKEYRDKHDVKLEKMKRS